MADSNEILLSRSAQGDEKAFAQLVRPHQPTLARYIRCQIGDAEDAEDVFQETLLAAWMGLGRLRDAGSLRAWLMQVARSRCRDYFRARGRRDAPAGEQELEAFASRFGLSQHRRAQPMADIVDALDDVPLPPVRPCGGSIWKVSASPRSPPRRAARPARSGAGFSRRVVPSAPLWGLISRKGVL